MKTTRELGEESRQRYEEWLELLLKTTPSPQSNAEVLAAQTAYMDAEAAHVKARQAEAMEALSWAYRVVQRAQLTKHNRNELR